MKNPNKYDEYARKVSEFNEELKKESELKFNRDKVLYFLLLLLTIGLLSIFFSLFQIKFSVRL